MPVIVPQLDTLSATTVHRLVDDFMTDLEAIPDHLVNRLLKNRFGMPAVPPKVRGMGV